MPAGIWLHEHCSQSYRCLDLGDRVVDVIDRPAIVQGVVAQPVVDRCSIHVDHEDLVALVPHRDPVNLGVVALLRHVDRGDLANRLVLEHPIDRFRPLDRQSAGPGIDPVVAEVPDLVLHLAPGMTGDQATVRRRLYRRLHGAQPQVHHEDMVPVEAGDLTVELSDVHDRIGWRAYILLVGYPTRIQDHWETLRPVGLRLVEDMGIIGISSQKDAGAHGCCEPGRLPGHRIAGHKINSLGWIRGYIGVVELEEHFQAQDAEIVGIVIAGTDPHNPGRLLLTGIRSNRE